MMAVPHAARDLAQYLASGHALHLHRHNHLPHKGSGQYNPTWRLVVQDSSPKTVRICKEQPERCFKLKLKHIRRDDEIHDV